MISAELQKKIDRVIKLIRLAGADGEVVQVSYSGGKDSDVILQLTKEAGINYRAIYNNTTIDPPGTIAHAREMGAEIRQPKRSFYKIVEANGIPNRRRRFCCAELKEKKILDKCIIGVRRDESTRRAARYKEPTECRWFGAKKPENHVERFYPLLDWTTKDVVDFINDRGIKIHPLYYREDGTIDGSRRLGCIGCPLSSYHKRLAQLKEHPAFTRALIRSACKYIDTHPNAPVVKRGKNGYRYFYENYFFNNSWEYGKKAQEEKLFETDYKALLEDYFKIKL